jgi:hypothetical protein
MHFVANQNFDRDSGQGSCFLLLCESEELDAYGPEMGNLL